MNSLPTRTAHPGGFSIFIKEPKPCNSRKSLFQLKIKFNFKKRGLIFNDEQRASHYLSNISFYRLRAYTYPFQDNSSKNHPFTLKISFEEIIDLYVFDRK